MRISDWSSDVCSSDLPMIIEQIRNQLDRLVPIHQVHDLTEEGPFVARELALVKVIAKAKSHERRESLRIAEIFGATVTDPTINSFVFAMTGSPEKVNALDRKSVVWGKGVSVRVELGGRTNL